MAREILVFFAGQFWYVTSHNESIFGSNGIWRQRHKLEVSCFSYYLHIVN